MFILDALTFASLAEIYKKVFANNGELIVVLYKLIVNAVNTLNPIAVKSIVIL